MRTLTILLVLTVSLAAAGCSEPRKLPVARVGTYDSRAITIAAFGSSYYADRIEPLEAEFRKAKADGDQKRIKELEPQVWARRKRTHRQGFSTAPVDDILDYIQDDIPRIRKNAGVETILSKWDREAMAKYKSVEKVDVTMPLVDAFHPNARQRKAAVSIQEKKPVPLADLDKHFEKGGH